MEPKIAFTTHCPNCGHDLFFSATPDHQCHDCGFKVEVFQSRSEVFDRFRTYLREPEVIVTDPVKTMSGQWVLSSTRIMLV